MSNTQSPAHAVGVAIAALRTYGATADGQNLYQQEITVLNALRLVARSYHHADDLSEVVCTVPDCLGCDTYAGVLA